MRVGGGIGGGGVRCVVVGGFSLLGLRSETKRAIRPITMRTARPRTIITWVRSPVFQKLAMYCWTAPRADWSAGSSKRGAGVALGGGVTMTALAVAVGAGVGVALAGAGVAVGVGTRAHEVLVGLVAALHAP
ncbi:MAG: hypothetical protein COU68_02275 [Candidatus Pacebacteria bacterium CG10_big_fil_rev_8_21_14_0_10_45_6]|nr:MAG: hypothetical protein COU68_02275 [Candidatus Pacebacteria bacterium CG10_big_fil_rev_8_21_14_0_10_45_6]